MPEHFYAGPSAGHYPMGRDAQGLPIGAVEPGDIRDLDDAPDPSWLPRDGNEELLALLLAQREPADEDRSGEEAAPPADVGPARSRSRRARDTGTEVPPDITTAGDAGSEES